MTQKGKEDAVAPDSQDGTSTDLPQRTPWGLEKSKDPGNKSAKTMRHQVKEPLCDMLYVAQKSSGTLEATMQEDSVLSLHPEPEEQERAAI